MRIRVLIVAALVIVGCGGGDDETAAPTTRAASSGTTIDPVKRASFLSAASLVKPGIAATNEERVVSAGRNTCQQLATGSPRANVVSNGVKRFSVNGQQVTADEADRLVAAAERTLC